MTPVAYSQCRTFLAVVFPQRTLRAIALIDWGLLSVVNRAVRELPVLSASFRVMLNSDVAEVDLGWQSDGENGRVIPGVLVGRRYAMAACEMMLFNVPGQACVSGLRLWPRGYCKNAVASMAAALAEPALPPPALVDEREEAVVRFIRSFHSCRDGRVTSGFVRKALRRRVVRALITVGKDLADSVIDPLLECWLSVGTSGRRKVALRPRLANGFVVVRRLSDRADLDFTERAEVTEWCTPGWYAWLVAGQWRPGPCLPPLQLPAMHTVQPSASVPHGLVPAAETADGLEVTTTRWARPRRHAHRPCTRPRLSTTAPSPRQSVQTVLQETKMTWPQPRRHTTTWPSSRTHCEPDATLRRALS